MASSNSITIKAKNKPLKEVLREIEKQSDITFVYSSSTINVNQMVTLSCTNEQINSVLDKLSTSANISYTIDSKKVMLAPAKGKENSSQNQQQNGKQAGYSKEKVIKGKVVDEKGVGIPGASVFVKGTSVGTATDINGGFALALPQGASSLVVSFIGYAMEEKKIASNSSDIFYQFDLKPENTKIDEVIVTGYQTISKERATGSFTVVSPKDLEGKLQTNIMSRLEGQVAGLSSYKDNPVIRGVSTLSGNKTPLYVVDGIPCEGELGAKNPLETINPTEIVNVTVLKDATAASIYGARSTNGVIVITTRNGAVGKTTVNYSGSIKFQGLPDRDYANKMSSAEFVDYQRDIFKLYPIRRSDVNTWQNDVQVLLLDNKEGKITDAQLEEGLNYYRNRDRYNEVIDAFLRRNSITQQHNLAFSGGTEVHKYHVSVNYMKNQPYERVQSNDRLGFNIKNTFNFFKWMKADVGIIGSSSYSNYDNGVLGMSMLNTGIASYYTLRDEDGNPSQWYNSKSQAEIDRLKGKGLLDETYIPLNELDKRHYSAKSNYVNLNFGVTFKLIDGLNAELHYQNERTDGYTKQYDTKDANKVKTMINDATVVDATGKVIRYIPLGGQLLKNFNNSNSFTLRGQLNFTKSFNNKHDVQALLGVEQREAITMGDGVYRLGYDDQTLNYSPFDEATLNKTLTGTQSQTGSFYYSSFRQSPSKSYSEDRFMSYYANGSYTFDRRFTATGSIRLDQSNLFGTDFRKQFKPMWSIGSQYVILEDKFGWLDRLVGRATYGANGNLAKLNGPYTIEMDYSYNNGITNEPQAYISTPPNPDLRWERTAIANFAIDFSFFKNKLFGSVEYYNKNTSDLLAKFAVDPTLGWSSLMKNVGSMNNKGVEITLNSTNINYRDFRWTSSFVFGYNKNEMTKVENNSEDAYSYYYSTNIRKGYPLNALFSIRYAGLDETGLPKAYKKDGTIIKEYDKLTKDDLVYSGTIDPPYNASLTNSFSYKGFDLSFMFIYYGGNVMRDIRAASIMSTHPVYYTTNRDRDFLNYWKKPGDELDPKTNPAFLFGNPMRPSAMYIWGAADKHIQKGDFIKLRDLTLGYTLPSVLLKKLLVQSVRINLQAQNLWKWVANENGLDPEVWSGSSLTPSRGTLLPATYTIGLSVNF
jgi:TonB-linked outer membrane protein, SusC/RagA family